MARARFRLVAALVALTLPLALAPGAQADAFDRIFKEYQSTGAIDACRYSEADLKEAKGEVPNDIEAYAPDFPNALEGALEQRAGGACDSAKQQPSGGAAAAGTPGATTPTTPTTPAAPAAPGSTVTPAPTPDPTAAAAVDDQAIARSAQLAKASDAGTPAPVVALAVLGAMLALAGLVYGLTHWLAVDPRWARTTRHAFAEAGWRASNTWSEFTDWVRLSR